MTALFTTVVAPGVLRASQSATVNPVADSFLDSAAPSSNYGAAGALGVSASGSTNGEFVSALRFDLTGSKAAFDAFYGPGGWFVQSASVRLTATPPNNSIFNAPAAGLFNVTWMQNDSWVEGSGTPGSPSASGVTYNDLPSLVGPNDALLGAYGYGGGTSGSSTYSLGLPANFVNDLLAGGPISLRLSAADSAISYLFNSRNFGTAASRPALTVTVVPEPAFLFCYSVGLAILTLRARTPRPEKSA